MAARSRALRFKLILAVGLFVLVAWSVLWFVAATIADRQVERTLHRAAAAGTQIVCRDRGIKGFPFRLEIRCGRGSGAETPTMALDVGGLVATALVYNPSRVIAEARGPLELAVPGLPPIVLDWELAHASARLNFDARSLERIDAEVLRARLRTNGHAFAAQDVDLNVRADPADPENLDVALRLDGFSPVEGGETADLALRGSIGGGAALLAGRTDRVAAILADGLPIVLEAAKLGIGALELAAKGAVTLGADGLVDGTLEVAIAGHEGTLPYVAVVAPGAEESVSQLLTNILAFAPATTIGERPAKKLVLSIADSQVRAGFVPLFRLPPLIASDR